MSSYADTAWGYDVDGIGYEPGTTNRFVPNSKELKLFKEEKSNMYKGTWMICLVYGISALTLLGVVFLTDWGRTYVYEKFLPAVLTFVIGAIFIIVYLLFSIFALQPRKIGKGFDTSLSCPDYWKLQKVDSVRKSAIIDNNVRYDSESNCSPSDSGGSGCDLTINNSDKYHVKNRDNKSIVTRNSKNINYKCVPDSNVLGKTAIYKNMKEKLNSKDKTYFANTYRESDFKTSQISHIYGGTNSSATVSEQQDQEEKLQNKNSFLYKNATVKVDGTDEEGNTIQSYQYIDGVDASNKLLKYASLTGAYKSDWKRTGTIATDHTPFEGSLFVDEKKTYEEKPLICNEIYQGLLDDLEEEEGEDKLKCELAKTCGISWSKLNCDQKA